MRHDNVVMITLVRLMMLSYQIIGRQPSITASSRAARGGELLVSIGHQPGAVDKLTVVVLKARNLPSSTDQTSNGYLASTLTGTMTDGFHRTSVRLFYVRRQTVPEPRCCRSKCSTYIHTYIHKSFIKMMTKRIKLTRYTIKSI